MRFWDTSAIVPLVTNEATTPLIRNTLLADYDLMVSAFTIVEVNSALARRFRESGDTRMLERARDDLRELSGGWFEVAFDAEVRRTASALLFRHSLRAADALHLAAAITANVTTIFVTLDQTLAEAARAEGFVVQP